MKLGERGIEQYLQWIRWLLVLASAVPVVLGMFQEPSSLDSYWLILCLAALATQALSFVPWPLGQSTRLTLFLTLDILLWNGVVLLTGGASNPFAALLLIPLVLAFLLLPFGYAALVLAVSVACQLMQLQFVPDAHAGHAGMDQHFVAMATGFIIAAVLLALTLLYLRRQIYARDRDLQKMRETQLRDEQLLAIGTAAAQLTHEMATPVQSVRLLVEEWEEMASMDEDGDSYRVDASEHLFDIRRQLSRMEQLLTDWREIAEDVRERRHRPIMLTWLVRSVRELLVITRPGDQVQWQGIEALSGAQVLADRTLIPAVLSLLHNALDAAGASVVITHSEIKDGYWKLTILNGGQPLSQTTRAQLGAASVASETGFGVGALVSYATLERFGGRVYWQTEERIMGEATTSTLLELPLMDDNANEGSQSVAAV